MKYRRKPLIIEAYQFSGNVDNPGWPSDWLTAKHWFAYMAEPQSCYFECNEHIYRAAYGDYIVKHSGGYFLHYQKEQFEQEYEPAE